MSDNTQPISREIPADLVAQLESIACNDSFAPEATLETAYEQLHTLAQAILNGNEPTTTKTPPPDRNIHHYQCTYRYWYTHHAAHPP